MVDIKPNASSIAPRSEGGYIVTGDVNQVEIYTSAASAAPGAEHDWVNIVTNDQGSASLDIDCLKHLIEALTAIRDSRRPKNADWQKAFTINLDRIARLRREGKLLMHDAGGSAHDRSLFAITFKEFDTRSILAHTSDAVTAEIGEAPLIRWAHLYPDMNTHRVDGATITMQAKLQADRFDSKEFDLRVLVIVKDAADPYGSPVIDLPR